MSPVFAFLVSVPLSALIDFDTDLTSIPIGLLGIELEGEGAADSPAAIFTPHIAAATYRE